MDSLSTETWLSVVDRLSIGRAKGLVLDSLSSMVGLSVVDGLSIVDELSTMDRLSWIA